MSNDEPQTAPPRPPRWWRWLKRLGLLALTLVVFGWAGLVALLYFKQNDMLFVPTEELAGTPRDVGMPYEELAVETADGETLAAWWLPRDDARCSVIHFHGNAGNRSHRLPDAQRFAELGCNVFMVDYRGYGGSTGAPSEEGTYADALASWDAAVGAGADPKSTVVFGRSLGGPIAAYLASQRPAAGLVLESTFESLPALSDDLFPWLSFEWLVRNEYSTVSHLTAFDGPVLVLHSTEDDLIPFAHGQTLAAKAGERGRFVELRGDHNHGPSQTGQGYRDAMSDFVDVVVAP